MLKITGALPLRTSSIKWQNKRKMKEVYKRYSLLVEKNKERIHNAIDYIWKHPEVGYKEWKTSAYLEREFEALGYEVKRAGDIPGFIAEFNTGKPGPKIGVMGELDALMCATHPEADEVTKAVHACGHHIQTAAMLGVAAAFKEDGAGEGLCGSVRFLAVPAEETIDLAFREGLVERGVIQYMAGKIEFLRRGFFDDVDMAIMFHADTREDVLFKFIDGCDGCITKHFEYKGVAAHAGGAPHNGINALYAATLGLQACNSLRETFQEKDYVRWHPIVTQAGVAANAIPAVASLDSYVRAATWDAMIATNKKINRAIAASAAALGAHVTVQDKPGNLPFHSNVPMSRCMEQIITDMFGENQIAYAGWDTQSSDVGDISSLIPVIQHMCMGAVGTQHGEDYYIADKEKAALNPAKVMTCLIYELLKDDGALGKQVIEEYKPLYKTKEEYFTSINMIGMHKELVEYKEDTTVLLI